MAHRAVCELLNLNAVVLHELLSSLSFLWIVRSVERAKDEGALALGAALAKGFAPEHIDLSDNMLTDTGALGLVEQALKHGPALVWLDLRANPLITTEGRHEARAAAERAPFDLLL